MNPLQRKAHRLGCLLRQAQTGRNFIFKAGTRTGRSHHAWARSRGLAGCDQRLSARRDVLLGRSRSRCVVRSRTHRAAESDGLCLRSDRGSRGIRHRDRSQGTPLSISSLGRLRPGRGSFFHAPANAAHISHSLVNLQKTSGDGFKARCRKPTSIMREPGHDHIDLLRIDIEGAEYAVLNSMP